MRSRLIPARVAVAMGVAVCAALARAQSHAADAAASYPNGPVRSIV